MVHVRGAGRATDPCVRNARACSAFRSMCFCRWAESLTGWASRSIAVLPSGRLPTGSNLCARCFFGFFALPIARAAPSGQLPTPAGAPVHVSHETPSLGRAGLLGALVMTYRDLTVNSTPPPAGRSGRAPWWASSSCICASTDGRTWRRGLCQRRRSTRRPSRARARSAPLTSALASCSKRRPRRRTLTLRICRTARVRRRCGWASRPAIGSDQLTHTPPPAARARCTQRRPQSQRAQALMCDRARRAPLRLRRRRTTRRSCAALARRASTLAHNPTITSSPLPTMRRLSV